MNPVRTTRTLPLGECGGGAGAVKDNEDQKEGADKMSETSNAKRKSAVPRPRKSAKAMMVGGKLPNNALVVSKADDEDEHRAIARTILGPDFRHATAVSQILKSQFGSLAGGPGFGDYADAINDRGTDAAKGDMDATCRVLAAQAMTLDMVFTEMARRMALNMAEHLSATDTYARIALKAQAQSRATLETLAKIHQPREQTVRHVHVNEGGQAVIADQVHNHAGVLGNEESIKQSLTTADAGALAALPCPDPLGNGMPAPSRQREAEMQDARRDEPGRP